MPNFRDFDRSIAQFFREFGGTATYIVQGSSVFDPATGENVVSNLERPVRVILQDFETTTSGGLTSRNGTQIMQGDKQAFLLPPEKADPLSLPLVIDTTTSLLRVGSVTYKIKNVKVADPTSANALLYELHLGR